MYINTECMLHDHHKRECGKASLPVNEGSASKVIQDPLSGRGEVERGRREHGI